jgi:tetrahydromethanopterin S-methyltransferase subunit B
VIPEATGTIICAIQSGSADSVAWTSIIGPIIGGILATGFGAILVGWRERKERIQKREQIASALLVDVMRSYVIMSEFPTLDPDHTRAVVHRFANSNQGEIRLYPRNGMFAAYYADITILGMDITTRIVSLYHNLEKLEKLFARIRDCPEQEIEIFNAREPVSIHRIIVDVKNQIDELEDILESIVTNSKPRKVNFPDGSTG